MDKITFYKNFNMGRELENAGDFIYESAIRMMQLDYICNHFDINAILYYGSVGVERLQKILICLKNIKEEKDIIEPEVELKKHNHLELQKILDSNGICVEKNERSLLGLYQDYYNNYRYAEYKIGFDENKLINMFSSFLSKSGKKYEKESIYTDKQKNEFKKFYIHIVGKVSKYYFEKIRDEASVLGIYTYEINGTSNAAKVFLYDRELFEEIEYEKLALKELLLSISMKQYKKGIFVYANKIKPLDLDETDIKEALEDITRYKPSIFLTELVKDMYCEFNEEELEERKETINIFGNKDIYL